MKFFVVNEEKNELLGIYEDVNFMQFYEEFNITNIVEKWVNIEDLNQIQEKARFYYLTLKFITPSRNYAWEFFNDNE